MIAFPEIVVSTPTAAAETDALGDEIARHSAHLDAATYQLLVMIREFDERGGWGNGFRSCAHWLSWRTSIGPGSARERVRVAKALGSLPLMSEAMSQGRMSFSKARALTRVATPENEEELVELARHATAAHIEKLVRAWRMVDRQEISELEAERHQSRQLAVFPDMDGSYVIRGRLDPEVGALLAKALDWASEALYREESGETGEAMNGNVGSEPTATIDQRRADALGLLAERAMAVAELDEGADRRTDQFPPRPLGRADRFQVVVHVEADTLRRVSAIDDDGDGDFGGGSGQFDNDQDVSAETSRRLACDSSIVPMLHDSSGQILDVGRKRRSVPPALRRVLDYRDGGCRFPGCGVRYTDAHHMVHWADGGETKLDNLVNLCRRHHRAVHEEGYRVEVGEGCGRTVEGGGRGGPALGFFRPDGKEIPMVPDFPPVPAGPAEELVRTHQSLGIEPDEWTPTPRWMGEVFDFSLALDMYRGYPRGN